MSDQLTVEHPPIVTAPVTEAAPKQVVSLVWNEPFRWLGLGWRDFASHPVISFLYGLPFWCMALVLEAVFHAEPEYAMSVVSGGLLIAPFVAMGLYDLSRRREKFQRFNPLGSLTCWKKHLRSMGMLTGILLVIAMLWGRASLIITALFFDTVMPSDFDVMEAALDAQNWEFVIAYVAVAGASVALLFTLCVVSVPMILDRDTDAITAAIASAEVVGNNTGVMVLWAALIVVLVAVSVWLPFFAGLAVAAPVLGHASWHAYRSVVRWM